MKLNRKGYMLVEIIISFTLAMSIAYYLLNLTYKFKNMDEDIYMSTIFIKDKILVTKNIMNDIDRGTVSDIPASVDENTSSITFNLHLNNAPSDSSPEKRRISISEDGKTITYGIPDGETGWKQDDISYYTKTIDDALIIKGFEIKSSQYGNYFSIIIKISSLYNEDEYDIKLFGQQFNNS